MIQMEDTLSQVRREYDLQRIEFEQMLAANEQTGKLHLVNYLLCSASFSLQIYARRLKKYLNCCVCI